MKTDGLMYFLIAKV